MGRLCIFILSAFMISSFAVADGLEDADYTTPDSWSQHITSNGFKFQGINHDIFGGSANLSLTTKFRQFDNDYASDMDIYQYLRVRYADGELKNGGTVSGALFLRAAKDLNGRSGDDWGKNRYYFYDDSLDVEEAEQNGSPRLYHAYLKFSDVIKNTEVTLGRVYIDRIDTYHLDGADAQVALLDDKFKIFVYSGKPVSFYYDTEDDMLYGGGIEVVPFEMLKVRAIYTDIDVSDQKNDLYKVRADLSLGKGSAYGEYASVDSDAYYKLGGIYRIPETKTTVAVDYEELLDEIANNEGSYVTNPITYTLFPYGKYNKVKVKLSQGITSNLVVGVSGQFKNADGYELDNRDYKRYSAFLDLVRFPTENTYISINADLWDVDSTDYGESDRSVTFGGQVTQVINDNADIWFGTTFERFEYDSEDDEMQDWIRYYYIGGQYTFAEKFSVTADGGLEESEMLGSDASNFEKNYVAELWLNIAI